MVDQINSYFDKENISTPQDTDMDESPFLVPEFVSTNVLEPTQSHEIKRSPTIIYRYPKVLSNKCEATDSKDQGKSKVVKIIRLKPVTLQSKTSREIKSQTTAVYRKPNQSDIKSNHQAKDAAPQLEAKAVRIIKLSPGKLKRLTVVYRKPDPIDTTTQCEAKEPTSPSETKTVRIIKLTPKNFQPAASREIKRPSTVLYHTRDESVKRTKCEMKDTAAPSETKTVRIIKLSPDKFQSTASREIKRPPTVVYHKRDESVTRTQCEMKDTAASSETKVVRIYKLNRANSETLSTVKAKNKVLSKVELKNDSSKPKNVEQVECKTTIAPQHVIIVEIEPVIFRSHAKKVPVESALKPKNWLQQLKQTETKFPIPYFRQRSCCYQCEMLPRVYEPTELRRHICPFCKIWFPNHFEFEIHVQEIHNKVANYVKCSEFYCYVCAKEFPYRQYLTAHLKKHVDDSLQLCAVCGIQVKYRRINEHMKVHQDRIYDCDKCDKKFNRIERLRQHLWCHNTNLTFVCQVCSKRFKSKKYLDRHKAIHGTKKLQCKYCYAQFYFSSVRRAHEISRHNVV